MRKASTLFNDADRRRVAEAVAQAERTTSGEIVPVVATVSGRYDRGEDLFGLLTALIALAALWCLFPAAAADSWGEGGTALPLVGALLAVFLGFAAGAALATRFPVLRLPFVTAAEMREEVERAALEQFQRRRLRATADATGVLIYLSLHERMVRIVGDDGIAAKIGQEEWDKVRDLVIAGMKADRLVEAVVDAVTYSGELLARHFPIQAGDANELGNELIVIDP